MAEILGAGITHYPPLITPDEDRGFPLTRTLKHNTNVPEDMKIPTNWPEPMRIEYGEERTQVSRGTPGTAGQRVPADTVGHRRFQS